MTEFNTRYDAPIYNQCDIRTMHESLQEALAAPLGYSPCPWSSDEADARWAIGLLMRAYRIHHTSPVVQVMAEEEFSPTFCDLVREWQWQDAQKTETSEYNYA